MLCKEICSVRHGTTTIACIIRWKMGFDVININFGILFINEIEIKTTTKKQRKYSDYFPFLDYSAHLNVFNSIESLVLLVNIVKI